MQFALVAAGIVLVAREGRRAGPSTETLRDVAETIASASADHVAVVAAVANAEKLLQTKLAVFDDRDELVAGTPFEEPGRRPPPPFVEGREAHEPPRFGPPPEGRPPDGLPPFLGSHPHPFGPPRVPIALRDGRVWQLVITAPRPLPSMLRGVGSTVVLVLLVVGVSGWWTARSLIGPLRRLSSAARAFGAGNLEARAALDRSDELGEVSAAFDEMAERVTQALRAEKELLANVSHELRTPLQRIQIAIDLAAEGDADTARESLVDIAEDLGELNRIVEDVLSAARLSLQNGGGTATALPPIRAVPVDVGALLQKSVTRFRSLHPTRRLDVELGADLPTASLDAVLVRRAVDNLLDNADKYTDSPDARVTLVGLRAEASVVVEVRDHGVGIAPDDYERLFEPFFRADRSRTRGTGGLGLGLLLAKRIVEAHGGTLSIASEVGVGTTARITLPLATGVAAS